jgi:murein DD-endopeptidase MepM/ murein hydrolase activator NlpD
MSEKNTTPVLNFVKKNFYYLLIGISLIVIATVIAIILATNQNSLGQSGLTPNTPSESVIQNKPESIVESMPEQEPSSKEEESQPDKPTSTQIIFALPVANSTVTKSYTSSTVDYNQTLGVYTGHMGIDFSAEAGSNVVAVWDGKIESITTSYLKGTTIVIDHGNGLKSIYNSLDSLETLAEGQSVNKGEVIGYVSDNNRQEYKDGPHLHFEVTLNGEWIDPDEYLMMTEK